MIKGCASDACWQIGFRAWAAGHPKSDRTKIEAYMGLAVCQACSADLKLSDVIAPAGAEWIQANFTSRNLAPPDLVNAELQLAPLLDGRLNMGPFK